MRWTTWLKCGFVALTSASVFHNNIAEPFLPGIASARTGSSGPLAALYDRAVGAGEHLGMGTTWRMYTPVPRRVRLARVYALAPDGTWSQVPLRNLGPAHRDTRSWADAWLFDFKQARIVYNLFYARENPRATSAYLAYLARKVEAEQGYVPRAMRAVVRAEPIPPPGREEGFSPLDAELDTVLTDHVFH